LLDLKILSPKELDALLEQQRKLQETMDRQPLGVLLVEMGYTTHEKYLGALSKHFNMPIIPLEDFIPHPSLQKAIGEKYAQKHKIVVLENGLDKIKLAVAEPKENLVYELRKKFVPLKTIEFFLAHPSQIDSCFHRLSNSFSVTQIK
jgi:hypothetical protein